MRNQMGPLIVGLVLASLPLLIFLNAASKGEVSIARDWMRAAVVVSAAFGIGWASANILAKVVTDRRRASIVGLSLFIVMGLCPPWEYTFSPPGAPTTTKPAGYHLLFEPPQPESGNALSGVRVDITRLAIQWAVLAALVGVAYVSLTRPPAG